MFGTRVEKRTNQFNIYIMQLIIDKYKTKILGVLSCFDRVVIKGTLQGISYAEGMAFFLRSEKIPIFGYVKFAETLRDKIIQNAENLAKSHGIKIIPVNKRKVSKENIAKSALSALQEKKNKTKGDANDANNVNGLICIISAVERCPSFRPVREENGGFTLKFKERQCLHYYFYIMDEYLGLCYVRVPTWLPVRLQVYFNGHNWLAAQLDKIGIKYTMIDNAFVDIEDFQKAQQISDGFSIKALHDKLDQFAQEYCPEYKYFDRPYHWSVMQAEYATDIVFRRQKDLQMIYSNLISTAIHTVKPDNIATFLGRKITGNYKGEAGNNYTVRKEGSRIKHTMQAASIKMYDKHQQVLRFETTVNDISFFKHYRKVDHRDGSNSMAFTSMKKSIYSFGPLMEIMKTSNRRYLEFISTIEDKSVGIKRLKKVSRRVEKNRRGYKGINFFDDDDLKIIQTVLRGEFNIAGFRNKDIRRYLIDKNPGQISRLLKRLKVHGLIKKANNSYKYYLTKLGKQVSSTALKVRELILIPEMNHP